jgi:hypothetical protein
MSYLNPVYMLCNIHFNIISIVHKIVHAWDWSLISRAPNTMFHNVWFMNIDEVKYSRTSIIRANDRLPLAG